MKYKKAICHLWGHDFIMDSGTFYSLEEDNKSVCSRCGKLKFMSFSDNSMADDSSSQIIFQNYKFMNNHQNMKVENRTLN
jgi:hypothetical protein